MCHGLPCVGAEVRLLRQFTTRGITLPQGTIGIVGREYQETRELDVDFRFQGRETSVRISENLIEVLRRPLVR